MQITRRRQAEHILQHQMNDGRRHQILTAHHIRHPLQTVIDDHRQRIGNITIAAAQHRVANLARKIKAAFAQPAVGKRHRLLRQAQANRRIIRRERIQHPATTTAGIDQPQSAHLRLRVPILAAAIARVEMRAQLRERRLIIGEMRRLQADFAVMMQAVRAQRLQLRRDVVGAAARAVNILHAQQPAPAMRAGIKITAKRRHQRAKMQGAAGRRRKAANVGFHVHRGFVPHWRRLA